MKKYWFLLFGIFLLVVFPSVAFAQSDGISAGSAPAVYPEKSILPVPPVQSTLPFGQKQYYTVTLRGNGDAVVYLKTIISNKENSPLASVNLTFPQTPQNLSVYQVFRERQCIRYKEFLPSTKESLRPTNECAQYQAPDYEYGWGNTTYQKAQFALDGNTVHVTLPKALEVNAAGSIILAYTLSGITDKNLFGAYDYTFETAKVNDTIQQLQVGIMTDPDFYIKDTKGTINYQAREAAGVGMAAPLAADISMSSVQFDQFYNQIGQGTIVKTASSLQPNESYKVKGLYADSRAKLYSQELAWGGGGVVLVLAVAFGVLFLSAKKVLHKKSENQDSAKHFTLLPVLGLSFGSSLLILLYTIGLYLFGFYFGQIFQYYSYNGFIYPLVFVLLAVISLSFYSLLLFVPGIFIGIKNGLISGIVTVILTLFWLIVYSVILAFLFFLFFQNRYGPVGPLPYAQSVDVMRSAVSEPAVAPAVDSSQ